LGGEGFPNRFGGWVVSGAGTEGDGELAVVIGLGRGVEAEVEAGEGDAAGEVGHVSGFNGTKGVAVSESDFDFGGLSGAEPDGDGGGGELAQGGTAEEGEAVFFKEGEVGWVVCDSGEGGVLVFRVVDFFDEDGFELSEDGEVGRGGDEGFGKGGESQKNQVKNEQGVKIKKLHVFLGG